MIAPVPETYRGQVIELGAGNGALTLRLAARCPERESWRVRSTRLWRATIDATLRAAGLSGRVELFAGSAAALLSELGKSGVEKPDFIISGIPLGNLGREKALALVDTIHRTLGEGGMFIQFQHSLLDRKKIRTRFPNLRTVPAFLNFPPAVVYYARG